MKIFRMSHVDMMGYVISEQFFDSKNKAKKALRKKLKELKPSIAIDGGSHDLPEPIVHRKQNHINGKSAKSFELLFEVWHKCSHEYDEWNTYVESLHIETIQVK